MTAGVTIDAGLPIPSTSPAFLAVVGVHFAAGLVSVVAGAGAMLSRKGRGRHSGLGRVYFWALAVGFVSATGLAVVRWVEDFPLFLLGASAMTAAILGRIAIRRGGPAGVRTHVVAMGWSYIARPPPSMSTTARARRSGACCRPLPSSYCQPWSAFPSSPMCSRAIR